MGSPKMIRCGLFLAALSLMIGNVAWGQKHELVFTSSEEQALFTHWETRQALPRGIWECLLIAEGATVQLSRSATWLSGLESELRKSIDPGDSFERKGELLYEFLHERVLRKYSEDASAASLMSKGEYSCVTATALYHHLAGLLDLKVTFHVTPFHICPILEAGRTRIWVEMTRPKEGFDVEYYDPDIVDVLLEGKLVTQEEVDRKGKEGVFDEFIQGHYQPSVVSLLGYHYYNQAIKLDSQGKREAAFWGLAKAEALETDDKNMHTVFDAAFLNLSLLERVESSYVQAVREYFRSRGQDSIAVGDALEGVCKGMSSLMSVNHSTAQAESLVTMLDATLPTAAREGDVMARLRQLVAVNKGGDFKRKGEYQKAFAILRAELRKDSTVAWIQDLYVQAGLDYAQKLARSGDGDQALLLLDSMYREMPSYDRLRETYAQIAVFDAMASGNYRTSPAVAHEKLMRAFGRDSTITYLRDALAAVHHELAMKEIRKSNWDAARSQVLQGLRFAPGNESLKSDLELLRKERPKSAR